MEKHKAVSEYNWKLAWVTGLEKYRQLGGITTEAFKFVITAIFINDI